MRHEDGNPNFSFLKPIGVLISCALCAHKVSIGMVGNNLAGDKIADQRGSKADCRG